MNLATIGVLALITAFLVYVKVIPSISDAYRTVKDKRIYHIFFVLAGILVAAQSAYSADQFDIPYIFAGFLIWSISMAAAFWKPDEGRWHVIFTYSGFVLCITLTVIQLWPTWKALTLLILLAYAIGYFAVHFFFKANKTYWQEIWFIVCALGPLIQRI